MVEHAGSTDVPRRPSAMDYSGPWRQPRITSEVVETGIAETGRRDRAGDLGLSLPAGNQPVEQIEHRLFSFLTKNWPGQPLVSRAVIVNLIAATTTRTGLRVPSPLDPGQYPKGIKVSKPQFAALQLRTDTFHGEWNYTILPRS